jgi:hypothetical protein
MSEAGIDADEIVPLSVSNAVESVCATKTETAREFSALCRLGLALRHGPETIILTNEGIDAIEDALFDRDETVRGMPPLSSILGIDAQLIPIH